MRYMTPIFYNVAYNVSSSFVARQVNEPGYCQVREGIRNHIHNAPKDIDLLHWLHRTALELVGQGGLGYSFDSLSEDVPYTVYTGAMKDLMYGNCIPHHRSV